MAKDTQNFGRGRTRKQNSSGQQNIACRCIAYVGLTVPGCLLLAANTCNGGDQHCTNGIEVIGYIYPYTHKKDNDKRKIVFGGCL